MLFRSAYQKLQKGSTSRLPTDTRHVCIAKFSFTSPERAQENNFFFLTKLAKIKKTKNKCMVPIYACISPKDLPAGCLFRHTQALGRFIVVVQ